MVHCVVFGGIVENRLAGRLTALEINIVMK